MMRLFLMLLALAGLLWFGAAVQAQEIPVTIEYFVPQPGGPVPDPATFDMWPHRDGVQPSQDYLNGTFGPETPDSSPTLQPDVINGITALHRLPGEPDVRGDEAGIRQQGGLDPTDIDDLLSLGFKMSTEIWIAPTPDQGTLVNFGAGNVKLNGGAFEFTTHGGELAFRMLFGTNGNGDPTVTVATDAFSFFENPDMWQHDLGPDFNDKFFTAEMIVQPDDFSGAHTTDVYVDGEHVIGPVIIDEFITSPDANTFRFGDCCGGTPDVEFAFTYARIEAEDLDPCQGDGCRFGIPDPGTAEPPISPGDSNLDKQFNTDDVVVVLSGNKFEKDEDATWAEGDWNGAPDAGFLYGGDPPPGDNRFTTLDIVAALGSGNYETGEIQLAAVKDEGQGDGQVTVTYDAADGNVSVQAAQAITSVSVESASGIFTEAAAQDLGGPFDVDTDDKVFKAVFGDSFSDVDFGAVAQAGLAKDLLLNDLIVSGSYLAGGTYGDGVELNYIPEPSALVLLGLGVCGLLGCVRRRVDC